MFVKIILGILVTSLPLCLGENIKEDTSLEDNDNLSINSKSLIDKLNKVIHLLSKKENKEGKKQQGKQPPYNVQEKIPPDSDLESTEDKPDKREYVDTDQVDPKEQPRKREHADMDPVVSGNDPDVNERLLEDIAATNEGTREKRKAYKRRNKNKKKKKKKPKLPAEPTPVVEPKLPIKPTPVDEPPVVAFNEHYPTTYSVDLGLMTNEMAFKKLRPGSATFTDSCDKVVKVTSALVKKLQVLPPINIKYYKKYTEAYGIPILGSVHVSDLGLQRACYIVRLMFASRYDVRNAFYHMYGRVSLIGKGEQTTSVYEHRLLDKAIDLDTRGIGPTLEVPVTSSGDDNMICDLKDRYHNQDILIHELSHGGHQLAAIFVIPGFQGRLRALFRKNVELKQMWRPTYAAKNYNEYFAMTTQFYFNSYQGTDYYDRFKVKDRESLRKYDPGVTELLEEVFPCAVKNGIVPRCGWRKCTAKAFDLVVSESYKMTSYCTEIDTKYIKNENLDECAQFACNLNGNTFNWKPGGQASTCKVLKCESIKKLADFNLKPTKSPSNVYKIIKLPVCNMKEESKHKLEQFCTKPPTDKGLCKLTSSDKKVPCGNQGEMDATTCVKVGCCWINNVCYEPKQNCIDKFLRYCPDIARGGECLRNPGYYLPMCPRSCGLCSQINAIDMDKVNKLCKDTIRECAEAKAENKCSLFGPRGCQLTCGLCKLSNKWAEQVGLNLLKIQI